MSIEETGGGLRKRRRFSTTIPSDTLRDKNLSFRARGVLCFLLDQAEGFDVRSEFIAASGTEGREAIRTALHELGRRGYYRIERRRMRGLDAAEGAKKPKNGTFVMGTAISEDPVPSWAADYAEFEGKPVPMLQQADGSFRIQHKDGTLTSDGFDAQPETEGDSPHEDARGIAPAPTGDGFLDAGSPGFGGPGPGRPASGDPGPGPRGALSNNTKKGHQEVKRTAGPSDPPLGGAVQGSLDGAPEAPSSPEEQQLEINRVAKRVTNEWIARYEQVHTGVEMSDRKSVFGAVRSIVAKELTAGVTEQHIKLALDYVRRPVPGKQDWSDALTIVRGGRVPERQRPGHRTGPANRFGANESRPAVSEAGARAIG